MRPPALSSSTATVGFNLRRGREQPFGLAYGAVMRFFDNGAINRIYLHSALLGLSEYGGGAFVLVFLLKANLTLPLVFLSLVAIVLLRLLFRQIVIPFAQIFGIRTALITGLVIGALAFIPIGHVQDAGPMLVLFLVLAGLGDAFYWACFHAMSAKLGDAEMRGAQVSVVQLVYSLSNIAGPLLGGLLQVGAGPVWAFGIAGAVRLLSAWPLLQTPEMVIERSAKISRHSKRFAAQVYFCDGFAQVCAGNAFSLALFMTLGENFQSFGLALAMAAVFGAVMALGIGRMFDLGHHKWSTAIGMTGAGVFVLIAALGYDRPITAVLALAMGAVVGPLYASAFNARVYNLSKLSGDALRFQVWGEGGWDLGGALGGLIAALLTWMGYSLTWPIAMGVLGTLGVWITLHRSYRTGAPSLRV